MSSIDNNKSWSDIKNAIIGVAFLSLLFWLILLPFRAAYWLLYYIFRPFSCWSESSRAQRTEYLFSSIVSIGILTLIIWASHQVWQDIQNCKPLNISSDIETTPDFVAPTETASETRTQETPIQEKPIASIELNWQERRQGLIEEFITEFKKPEIGHKATITLVNGSEMSGMLQSVDKSSLELKLQSKAVVCFQKQQLAVPDRIKYFADDYAYYHANKTLENEKEAWHAKTTDLLDKRSEESSLARVKQLALRASVHPHLKLKLSERIKDLDKALSNEASDIKRLIRNAKSNLKYLGSIPNPDYNMATGNTKLYRDLRGWTEFVKIEKAMIQAAESELARISAEQ